jgi:hypothetical protein
MRLDGQEFGVDEGRYAFIRVGLGFQPSAGPSHRSCAEVEQDRPARLLRLGQGGIDIFAPLNWHSMIL